MLSKVRALEVISLYYPLNLEYYDLEYERSLQYKRLLKLRLHHKNNSEIYKRIYEMLCDIFKGYKILNWTDLDSYNCYEFRILLHKNQPILDDDIDLVEMLGGKRLDLHLHISILEKCYFYYINETKYDSLTKEWSFRDSYKFDAFYDVLKKLEYDFKLHGYKKVSYEVANSLVSDVEMELIEKGEVKVFNCMFTEIFNI